MLSDRGYDTPAGRNGQAQARRKGAESTGGAIDLICLSHIRWDFVYQRPQHLMSRAARTQRVFFIEEAQPGDRTPRVKVTRKDGGVRVVTPYLDPNLPDDPRDEEMRELLSNIFSRYDITDYILWYYTPAAVSFTRHLTPLLRVYDCTDDLPGARESRRGLKALENELLRRCDLLFATGQSLFDAHKDHFANTYLFPSAVASEHFSQARSWTVPPGDQEFIPHPRLGYFGIIDERLDLELIDGLATGRPDWQLVLIGVGDGPAGPVSLPRQRNIHYLGHKPYAELPAYLAGWDVAIMPLALDHPALHVSLTKTAEFLAAGRPVVATPAADIIRPYAELGLVQVAASVPQFVAGVEAALGANGGREAWLRSVDSFLAQTSWDRTWHAMARLIEGQLNVRHGAALARARIARAHIGELLSDELSAPLS